MTLMIGGASALAAVASMPSWRLSTFLTILADLFAFETVLFGIADLVALLGYWPHAYEEYELPRYLPLATAIFVMVIFAVSHIPLVRKMMRIADPFFAARTPISIRPWPLPPMILRQSLYARINVFFLILINQFQVAVEPEVQLLAEGFRQRDPGRGRSASRSRSGISSCHIFVPLATIAIVGGHHRVLRRLEFRAAMAPLDDRVLHLALAPALDALQARAQHRQHRQPRPAHLAGRRQLHQRQRHRLELRQCRHLQLHHPG